MTAEEVRTAKQLFKVELEKLVVEAKVPMAIATSLKMKHAANATTERIAIRPVLEEEEEGVTEEYERIFEDEYCGEVPDVLVGLEFPQRGEIRWLCQRTKSKEDIYLPFWQFVVRKVSERRLEDCALTTNDLLNQEKEVEKIQASLNK
jgi:hypothetical protein